MAIKVYKGGSWVNATGVSAIGKADRLAIGQTNTSSSEADKLYYLSFVDANHPYTSRQYEDFYTGIGLTFSPVSSSLGVGGILYLSGTSQASDGDIHSKGGSDGNFGIFNEGSGFIELHVKSTSGSIGIASFSSQSGNDFAARQSIFQSNIYPKTHDNYDIGKSDSELRWNNVYANCFHGNGTGLTGTGFWEPDTKENLKAGTDAGKCINDHTCYNIFIGYEAGKNTASTAGGAADDGIADENIFIGRCSGHSNTTGGYNIFGGSNSGFCNLTGGCNVALGFKAGYCNDSGGCNIFLGLCAGRYTLTGSDNIFMGYQAGYCNRVHNDNIFLGFYSGKRTTGPDNIALGYSSLLGGPTGSGEAPLSGQGNVAIGCATGKLLGGGAHSYNVFLGGFAGQSQTAGSYNVVIGAHANTADLDAGCQLVIGGTTGDAVNWLTGTCDGDIKPFRGIIDCDNSTGSATEIQVLTSNGTNVQWATNVATATNANKVQITDDIDADDNSQIHYIHFGEETSGYDSVKVDSNGLSYYQARDDEKWVGIGTTSPHDSTGNAGGLTLSRGDGQVRLVMKNNDTGHSDGDGSHIVIGSKDFTFENRTSEGHLHWSTNIAATGATADIGKRMTLTPEGHVGIGTTNPISVEIATSLETNDNVLAVGIVTANEYYGRFKGTIDPGATITLDKIEASTGTYAQVVDTGSNGHFLVKTEGTERLRITPGGDVVVNHNSQDPTHSTSSGSIFLTPPSGNPNRGIMWSNTSDTHYVKLEPNVIDGLTINGFSGVVFATGSRTQSPSTWRERFRIDSSGRIGLLDDTTGGTLKSDNFGTNDQVLTSKGPNAAAVWQDLGGIPASTSNQVKVTKTSDKTKLYLTGVEVTNDSENATVDKTLYQNTAGTPIQTSLYMNTQSNTLHVHQIRGEVVDATGKTWPEVRGNLVLNGSNFIPDSVPSFDSEGDVNGGQNIGSQQYKFANVYAQNFVGHLGGTADTAKQLEVTKDNSSGTGHYFGMIRSIDESNPVAQTFYTDTALTYTPSSDMLQASNIKVTTNLNVTGNATLGDQLSDTVTWGARSGTILPSGTINNDVATGTNLGSANYKWDTVYAATFDGVFQGTADKADLVEVSGSNQNKDLSLTFIDWDTGNNPPDANPTYKGLKFDADRNLTYNALSNVLTVPNLAISGITTLGNSLNSDKTIFNSKVDSAIVPAPPASGQPVDRHDIGTPNDKWGIVYATEFSGTITGSVAQVNTQKADDIDGFVTFVENNNDNAAQSTVYTNSLLTYNSNASSEKLTVGSQLKVNKDAEFDEDVTLGSAADDKVIFNSKVDSHIFPSHNAANASDTSGKDLGDSNNYWRKVYAKDYAGTFTGTITSRNIAMTGDVHWSVDFDASGNVSSGSTIQTNAVDESMININNDPSDGDFLKYVDSTTGMKWVTNPGSGADADTLKINTANNDSDFYPTFVQSSGDSKDVFMDSELKYNPNKNILTISKFSPDGSVPSVANKVPLSLANGTWAWGDPTGGSSDTATNLAGGSAGDLPYQSAANTTAFLNISTTPGDVLRANTTTGLPEWGAAPAGSKIEQLDTSAEVVDTGSNGHFKVVTDNSERLRIESAGQWNLGNLGTDAVKYGESGYVLKSQGNNAPPVWGSIGDFTSGTTKVAKVYDAKTSGTAGGSYSALDGWVGRVLNSKTDPYSIVTWPAGASTGTGGTNHIFSLEAGTYKIYWNTPVFNLNSAQSKLIYADNDNFNSPSEVLGGNAWDSSSLGANSQTPTTGTAILTITGTTYFKIQIKGNTNEVTYGLGLPTSWGEEIYTQVEIEDLATAVKEGTTSSVATTLSTSSDYQYLTFVSGANAGTKTLLQDSGGLKYRPSDNTLSTDDIIVTGNTTLGNANTNTVTWNAKSGTILPSGALTNDVATGTNLGSADCKWDTIHANTITGTLTVDTSDKQVLYTSGTGSNAVAAGSDLFTYDGAILEVADAATATNYCWLTRDGGIEICRTNKNTGGNGGAFFDFRDDPLIAQDYIARIQLATHMADGGWNDPNDRGGLLFETGGTNHRHMLLNKDGILGITRGTDATAILADNGSNSWTTGFVPGKSRDASLNNQHNINNKVVLDANGTLMLRANPETGMTLANSREGGQLVLNNSNDLVGFSIDVYGKTSGNSTLRIIDEKSIIDNVRGTQRFAMNRNGAITFKTYSGQQGGGNDASNVDADYGSSDDILTSQGHGDHPVWKSLSAIGASKLTVINVYNTETYNLVSYTPHSDAKLLRVQMIGGGGGSGLTHNGSDAYSGGGGSYAEMWFDAADVINGAVQVGGQGTAGSGGWSGPPGGNGGESQFYTNFGQTPAAGVILKAGGGYGSSSYNQTNTNGTGGTAMVVNHTGKAMYSAGAGIFYPGHDGSQRPKEWTFAASGTYLSGVNDSFAGDGSRYWGKGGHGRVHNGSSGGDNGQTGNGGKVWITEFG